MAIMFLPKKRLPYLYNAIIRTGMAGTPDMPPLNQVGEQVVLPPFTADMPDMEEGKLRGLLLGHIGIFLHNAMFADDFPADTRLKRLFISGEKKLAKLKRNPWMTLMMDYGMRGECPSPEELEINLSAVDKVALAMGRPEWESIAPSVVVLFVDWMAENRKAVEAFYLNRLQVFS
jgi:hypothetical protein